MVDNLFAKALTEGWYHRGSKIAWMTLFVAYLELYISSFFFVRATRLYTPLCRSIRPSVCHTLLFCVFAVFGLTAPAQMME